MIRLQLKIELIKECLSIFQIISARKECATPSFVRFSKKNILKDYKKGIRVIEKKAKVFVELPKINGEGNGMISEIYDNEDDTLSKEIVVFDEETLIKNSKKEQLLADKENP